MANPPITIGLFTNVPAPGSPIRSDWPQQAANLISTSIDQGSASGPYVGGFPAGPWRLQARSGHANVTLSGFGDAIVNFTSPFPTGVIAVHAQAVGANVWWWPMINATFLTGFQFFATAVNGHPFATGHPPGQANVYTIVGTVAIDYIAFGV
jgi:hypothetical protein